MPEDTTEATEKQHFNRRDFLKLGGALAGSYALNELRRFGIDVVESAPDREVSTNLIKDELKDNLGLNRIDAQYYFLWPYSRAWVVVNNALAAKKLDGLTFEKGKEYSLIDLLGLEKSYKNNLDPSKGYISGIGSFTDPIVESEGISLTATAIGRAIAQAPVDITEWHTHMGFNNYTKYYFDKTMRYAGNAIFSRNGTDATVYSSNELTADLKFIPKENMRLRYVIETIDGQSVHLPDVKQTVGQLPQSLLKRFTKPLLLRVAIEAENGNDYKVELKPYQSGENGRIRAGFIREVSDNSGIVVRNKISANYDINGQYMP